MSNRSFQRRTVFVFSVVLLLAPAAITFAQKEKEVIDPNAYNADGVRASKRGDYKRAVEMFRRAFEIEPAQSKLKLNLQVALKNLSIDLARKGMADEAIKACSEAQSLYPNDVTVAAPLATYFNNQAVDLLGGLRLTDVVGAAQYAKENEDIFGRALEAVEIAAEVVERFRLIHLEPSIRKTHGLIFFLESRYYYLRNNRPEALTKLEKAIAVNPDEPRAYLDRSWIHYERKYYDGAISDLEDAIDIARDENPQLGAELEGLILRLTKEAEASNYELKGRGDYFVVTVVGGNASQRRVVEKELNAIRREVGEDILVYPRSQITVTIDLNRPLIRVAEWLANPPELVLGDSLEIGANGVALDGPDFRSALRFHYVLTLTADLAGNRAPYWFSRGLAQFVVGNGAGLTGEELEKLALASENGLLLGSDQLTWGNVSGLQNADVLRLVNLESKALVTYLGESVRSSGLGRIMEALREGSEFNQAMWDVARITPEQVNEEWRQVLGDAGM